MAGHRGKIFLALTITISIILVFLLASHFSNQGIPIKNPQSIPDYFTEEFTCQPDSNYPFTVTAHVVLADGMNRTEAISIADLVFKHEMTNTNYALKAADTDNSGIWIVNFSWDITHSFNVEINPLNQTATCRCY